MPSILCISCEFKGTDFIKAAKAAGNKVFLLTCKKLENRAWPREHLDDIFYVNEISHCRWNMEDVKSGLAWFMRRNKVDRIVALDDFDVEKAAQLREHFRIPGMGDTTARYFRDKLAMRIQARDAGLNVPAFSPLFNDDEIREYTSKVAPPWVVKPRSEASATGIRKVYNETDLWQVLDSLGDQRHQYLVEQFRPGDVYHVDALCSDGKVVFSRVSQYLATPFEVAHGGGIFRTVTSEFGGKDDKALSKLNAEVMKAFGMVYSACHTEFIKCHEDGNFYFLETASRVGGAHIAELVEFSSGINLWAEWAKLETAQVTGHTYELPTVQKQYAGLIISLSKYQQPDTSSFTDPEIQWRVEKDHHLGFIVKSARRERVLELLDHYAHRIKEEYHASAPPKSEGQWWEAH